MQDFSLCDVTNCRKQVIASQLRQCKNAIGALQRFIRKSPSKQEFGSSELSMPVDIQRSVFRSYSVLNPI